ncbi:MAG TPA: hypothetical protein VF064_00135 [Pyrinomonadaceae bacterium]
MSTADPRRFARRFAAILFAVSFAVNWVWEMSQMSAYAPMPGHTWKEVTLFCTAASVGDAVLTLLIVGAGALVARRRSWVAAFGWKAYAGAAFLGGVSAVVIEWAAVGSGYWSYAGAMPRVPLLEVGLWPFAQLALLVPFSLWAAGRLVDRFTGSGSHV